MRQTKATKQQNWEQRKRQHQKRKERINRELNEEAYREPSRSDIEAMQDCVRGHNEDS